MKNNKTQNTIKQLSLIDKLVLVSLSLLITSCIFGALTFVFQEGDFSVYWFLIFSPELFAIIGGIIFEEKIFLSIILIVISVILQIIALNLYTSTSISTAIKINKKISVINKIIWCYFIFTLLVSWFLSRLSFFSQPFG